MPPEMGVNDGAMRIGDFDGFLESIDETGDVVGTAARGILVGIVGVGFSAGAREGIEETGLFVGSHVIAKQANRKQGYQIEEIILFPMSQIFNQKKYIRNYLFIVEGKIIMGHFQISICSNDFDIIRVFDLKKNFILEDLQNQLEKTEYLSTLHM